MSNLISKSYLRKMAMFEPQYTMETEKDKQTLLKLIEDAPEEESWIPVKQKLPEHLAEQLKECQELELLDIRRLKNGKL